MNKPKKLSRENLDIEVTYSDRLFRILNVSNQMVHGQHLMKNTLFWYYPAFYDWVHLIYFHCLESCFLIFVLEQNFCLFAFQLSIYRRQLIDWQWNRGKDDVKTSFSDFFRHFYDFPFQLVLILNVVLGYTVRTYSPTLLIVRMLVPCVSSCWIQLAEYLCSPGRVAHLGWSTRTHWASAWRQHRTYSGRWRYLQWRLKLPSRRDRTRWEVALDIGGTMQPHFGKIWATFEFQGKFYKLRGMKFLMKT